METNPSNGRPRTVELDAFRLAILVHTLGEPGEGDVVARLEGERLAQQLDHLVRDPVALAFVVTDRVRAEGKGPEGHDVPRRRVRQLVGDLVRRRGASVDLARPTHRFEPPTWHRWDNLLSVLTCRGMLHLEVGSQGEHREVSYGLTALGARELARQVAQNPSLEAVRERCRLLGDALVQPLRQAGELEGESLSRALDDLRERLERFRRDEQIGLEHDLLAHFFQKTFGEPL